MTRRKKLITREPNGRPQREARQHSPTEIRRLRDAAMRGLRDAEWGTELGRLFLERKISAPMYFAGKRWREAAEKYRDVIGVFPIKSTSLQRGSLSHDPDPESPAGKKAHKRNAEAEENFMEAHAALVAAGMGAESAVRRLCEEDQVLTGHYDLLKAWDGLLALAVHYGA